MKKWMALVLALGMVLCLAGCGEKAVEADNAAPTREGALPLEMGIPGLEGGHSVFSEAYVSPREDGTLGTLTVTGELLPAGDGRVTVTAVLYMGNAEEPVDRFSFHVTGEAGKLRHEFKNLSLESVYYLKITNGGEASIEGSLTLS